MQGAFRELLFPCNCAGCGAAGYRLCAHCAIHLRQPPQRISAKIYSHIPLWSLGAYGGARRKIIIATKERNRRDMIAPLGAMLASAVSYLIAQGEVEEDIVLVPAPTSRRSALKRGGDPVTRVCQRTPFPVANLIEHRAGVRDSVGLSMRQRHTNMIGAVVPTPTAVRLHTAGGLSGFSVLLIDDILTTGATLAASTAVLSAMGVKIRGGLAWAHA
ncbi:ComF family protein [Corynebacterium sp. sy039]|uniref:ComF family protein n=1 Tax=Corynebacterium sp. sy039 TaxID=2599641 RepID=UPI0011B37E98|nr:ComF family protein [Corynebacterium sp. sy039]QDZ42130.1 ComF family protein [Corynebacterium sp. sy039]